MLSYYLVALLAGASTMTIELVAGRLIAPSVGVSLYTWTSVIGIVLAGISGGSFFGGWLADRVDARRLLPLALGAAAGCTALILPALGAALRLNLPPESPAILKVLLPVALLFALPSLAIGVVTPVVYRLCLVDLAHTGRVAGRLAACNALGSIAGTFLTGFYLIPAVGTRTIVYGVAALLLVLAATVWPSRRGVKAAAVVTLTAVLLGIGAGPLQWRIRDNPIIESAYYTIRLIEEPDPVVGTVTVLQLDNLVHSAGNPRRPDYLWYEYERVAAWVIERQLASTTRALFIGGGGYVLPAWLEHRRPATAIDVIEVDPLVSRLALERFVRPDTRIRTINADGRATLRAMPPDRRYDLVFADAYHDLSAPYHLTTREFAADVRAHLAPGGLLLANTIDTSDGPFLAAFAHTLRQVFPYVVILPGGARSSAGLRGPHLVAAALDPLPWDEWLRHHPFPFELVGREPRGEALLLTDDYAPVDNLLLPVTADALR